MESVGEILPLFLDFKTVNFYSFKKVKSLKLQMFTDFNGVSKEGHIERK